jgi:spore maturation protein A
MEELAKLEEERGTPAYSGSGGKERIASNEMCTFLILNISSLQLIPVNMIAYW